MKINLIAIINIIGILLFINAGLMLTCVPMAWYDGESTMNAWLASVGISLVLGALMYFSTFRLPSHKNVRKRDGYIIVTISWFVMAFSGTLPYTLSGSIPNFSNAFFESISGFTTTGATILDDIESLPRSILLWRSLTQWVGGLGFIVLVISILPYLGIGGMQLFLAEAPGITADKLKPRIQDTAKRLWLLYIGLTGMVTGLLYYGGMGIFDALNHGFTTLSTGGFSTKQASIEAYNSPFIEYVLSAFMFIGATSFVLLYLLIKGKYKRLIHNEEFRAFAAIIAMSTLVVAVVLLFQENYGLERAFRKSLFQVLALCTGTGFASTDFTHWGSGVSIIFFTLMFVGGCAGSTTGSVKVVRHLVIAKNSVLEFRRQLHLSAIIPVRLNGKAIPHEVTRNILAFVIIYLTIFGVCSVLLTFNGVDGITAMGSVASALGNVGPGLGSTGPSETYALMPALGKWMLGFLMVVGRLEIFTVLIIFSPYFWRSN